MSGCVCTLSDGCTPDGCNPITLPDYIQQMDRNRLVYDFDRFYMYEFLGPLSFSTNVIISIVMAIIQFSGAWDLFNRSKNYVGNREIRKIKWEKGFDQTASSNLASFRLPPTRYVVVLVSIVSCWDYTVKIAQSSDKNNSKYVGYDWDFSCYITYLCCCPCIIYDWAETLACEGLIFYSAAIFTSLFLGVCTEFFRNSAHWVNFFWSCVPLYIVFVLTLRRVSDILDVLKRHHCTQLAYNYLRSAAIFMYVGWPVFIIIWIVRDDIDPTHGWLHRDYSDIVNCALDFTCKPVFGYMVQQYKLIQEEIHMDEIMRVMHWDLDTENQPLMTDVPDEVVMVTTPALLIYAAKNYIDPESTKRAKKNILKQSKGRIMLTPEVVAAIESGVYDAATLRQLSHKASSDAQGTAPSKKAEVFGEFLQGKTETALKSGVTNLFGVLPPLTSGGYGALQVTTRPTSPEKPGQSGNLLSIKQSNSVTSIKSQQSLFVAEKALADSVEAQESAPSPEELVAMQRQLQEMMANLQRQQQYLQEQSQTPTRAAPAPVPLSQPQQSQGNALDGIPDWAVAALEMKRQREQK